MRCIYEKTNIGCRNQTYADYDYCQQHLDPCPFVVVKEHRDPDPKKYRASVICGKLPMVSSAYCPKHALLTEDEPNEKRRWHERMERHKQRKADQRAALETSPLRVPQ